LLRPRLIVWLPVLVLLAACEATTSPVGRSAQTPASSVAASPSGAFDWPGEHEDSPDLSFPSAADAVRFLAAHLDADIALPTWLPPGVDLDTGVSVSVGTYEGHRTAQVHLTTERGQTWGIEYGLSMLDGCAPEVSRPVRISGRPGRLRVSTDPQGSARRWTQLIWPATLKHPVGVYGLFGWLSPRAVLAMADSMPPVSSPAAPVLLNC
jgi:hypothetical protein